MPLVFEPTDVLHLSRYGVFTRWRYPGVAIPASSAVSIAASDTGTWLEPYGVPAHSTFSLPIREHRGQEKWAAIIERINWGKTSTPDLVYHELWNFGPFPGVVQEGFYASGKIGEADLDNPDIHPGATEKFEFRLWNCSGDAPRDVWTEVGVWLYWFPSDNLQKLLEISDINQMQEMNARHQAVVDELRRLREIVEARE